MLYSALCPSTFEFGVRAGGLGRLVYFGPCCVWMVFFTVILPFAKERCDVLQEQKYRLGRRIQEMDQLHLSLKALLDT
jgi:hypothetical protein